jgi:hypothetical protein
MKGIRHQRNQTSDISLYYSSVLKNMALACAKYENKSADNKEAC